MTHAPRAGRTVFTISAAVASLCLLAACNADERTTTAASVVSPVGFWGSEATDEPNLSFSAHSVTGTDGCNRLSGSWTQDDSGRIQFIQIASTEMDCEWVNTWLADLDSAVIGNAELHVFNEEGVEIGRLAKN